MVVVMALVCVGLLLAPSVTSHHPAGADITGIGTGSGSGGVVAAQQAVANATAASPQPTGNPWLTPTVTTSSTGMVTASSSAYATVGVQLPNGPTTATTPEGNATVATGTDGTNAVVTPGSGDVQLAQVMSAPPTSGTTTQYAYVYTLPVGYHLLLMTQPESSTVFVPPPGSVAITTATTESAVTQSNTEGFIQPAWARDANGSAVSTSYSILWGVVLIQTVNTAGVTAYPVVVDPDVTFGWVIYVYFSHSELYWEQVLHLVDGVGAGISWLCGLATWVLGIVCGLVFLWLATYFDGIIQTAYNRGGGVVFEWTYWLSYYGYMYAGSWS